MLATPPPDTKVQSETLEEIAERLRKKYRPRFVQMTKDSDELRDDLLSALRNEREARFELTEREKRILIDHHNYEAEKAITRTGCRTTERYHCDRVKAIREGR